MNSDIDIHNNNSTNFFNLNIKKIIGTSAKNPHQFFIQDDLIAYTASGGVVVCTIDIETNEVIAQRFFCANISYTNHSNHNSNNNNNNNGLKKRRSIIGSGTSSANAYLNMIKSYDYSEKELKRDLYGYPINSEPMEIFGTSIENFDDNYTSNNNDVNGSTNNGTSGNISPSKLKDKVRSINCITISSDKKLLAIGEIGYQPRILIFSLAANSSDNPIWSIYEHSFGINSLIFSPNLKVLCSLGLVNDGFINLWKIGGSNNTNTNNNSVNLIASNRCSNIVHKIVWHENLIITLGLRFIKLWKFDENDSNCTGGISKKPLVLKGKNAILGSLLNGNFIDASILNEDELLVITDTNQLLALKLNVENPKLVILKPPEYEFNSIVVDFHYEQVWLSTGNNYTIKSISFNELVPYNSTGGSSNNVIIPLSSKKLITAFTAKDNNNTISRPIIQIYDFSKTHLAFLTDQEEIKFMKKDNSDRDGINEKVLATSLLKNFAGIKYTHLKEFLAFSHQGIIKKFIDSSELQDIIKFNVIDMDIVPVSNSVTAIEKNDHNTLFIGDKYGTLTILELLDNNNNNNDYKILYQVKAHSSTINEIIYFTFSNHQICCSISRDRMIQIFICPINETNWDLLQTIPIHNGNLLQIIHLQDKIYVCSLDRTISIHKLVFEEKEKEQEEQEHSLRLYQEKIITLKSTPLCMKIFDNDLVVSTNDKSILVFDIVNNFELKRTLRLINDKINESLLVESFIKYRNLIIVWSNDKSLRAFHYQNGKEVGVAWGHLESVLELYLFNDHEIISIGNDACLFCWEVIENLKSSSSSSSSSSSFGSSAGSVISQDNNGKEIPEKQISAPLYTKVTRKILPTAPIKPIEKEGQITPTKINPTTTTTNSPIPKLTAATLKRLEAKQNGAGHTISPSRSISPIRSNSFPNSNSNSNSNSYSASTYSAPVKLSVRTLNFSKLQSPSKTPVINTTFPKRSTSPTRADTNKAKPSHPPHQPPPTITPYVSNSSPTPTSRPIVKKIERNKNLLDNTLGKLDDVANVITKCNDNEKQVIKQKLQLILSLVDKSKSKPKPTITSSSSIIEEEKQDQELLEKYSDKLMKMIEKKLSMTLLNQNNASTSSLSSSSSSSSCSSPSSPTPEALTKE